MARLAVVVTPKGGRDEVVGWKDAELAVRVRSAPEGGKANAAVCAVIASALGIPRSAVSVVRGSTSRHKLLEVGADEADVLAAFGAPGGAPGEGDGS